MNKLKMRMRKKVKIPGLSERYFEFEKGENVRVDDLNTMGFARVSGINGKYFWIAQEDLHTVTASV